MEQILSALLVMLLGIAGCVLYFVGSNVLLDRIYSIEGKSPDVASRNLRRIAMIRPWLFMGPALLALTRKALDDLAFAAQALDKEQSAIYKRLSAIRELYTEARAKGALGAENIVDALSRKGGAQ